jgi:signal transduction histidine kinase
MNLAATIAIASAALSFGVALVSRRISRAPGSGDQRWFAVAAVSAGTYALCNLGTTLAWPAAAVAWLSRVQVASVVVSLWAWAHYANALLARRPGRGERVALALLFALAPAALVPGVMFGGGVVDRPFAPLGVVYRQSVSTPSGDALMVGLVAVALLLLVRFLRAWRAGAPHGGLTAAAFLVLILFGANDALAVAGLDVPFLLDTGVSVPVLAMGWVITSRFVDSAREIERLRGDLAAEVETRTKDLAATLGALHQAEKLAALGQFASGVAHEVNSPAAVVTANLHYLAGATGAGALPPDAGEVLGDALAAMRRINDLVRKLVDAGRIAAVPGGVSSAAVSEVVAKAAAEARVRGGGHLTVVEAVPPGVAVRARRESLEQILAGLLANAADAIPRGREGRIEIRVERAGGKVRIAVSDDGAGMAPEVLRRAFDPFFTTKPDGSGTGLGLPVARGLVEAHGGSLRLESAPGAGTTAVVELPEAPPPA